jgi:hypothetical protein
MNFLIIDGLFFFTGFAHYDASGRRGVYNEDVLACTVAETTIYPLGVRNHS